MASDFATAPTTTTTYNDVSYTTIITDEVLDALMAVVVTPALLAHYPIENEASKGVKVPKADKFTAAALTEGTEVANTALTSDSVTATAAEIGIMATITDVLEVSDIPAAHGARLRQLGRSLGDKLDVDICTLFQSFSNSAGATTVNATLDNILDAIYQLEVNDAAGQGEVVGVLHPRQSADLRTDLEANTGVIYTSSSDARAGQAQNGLFGSWFGIDFYQSTNVPSSNAGEDRGGGVFVKDYALGMATKWAARVETMRWAPIRGVVLVATAMYTVFEVQDVAGVDFSTDL